MWDRERERERERERTRLDCRQESYGVDVGVEDGGQEPQPGWGVWIVNRELHLRLGGKGRGIR